MALLRKLYYKKPPDGLLEISERVYVFDCCFTTNAWDQESYKGYVGNIISQLKDYYSDASILIFNFREGDRTSQLGSVLSNYDLTIVEYPRHYEGCPLLSMEVIHHFLRSCETWLSLGMQNVLLMHCERGGWPVLAFMLASLLIYRKHYSGESKTLDMVYKQAPIELLHLFSPLNPIPSQLRYLKYVSRRNVATEWPPLDRALNLECVIMRMIPDVDGNGGCCPTFRIYGQDPYMPGDKTTKLLFFTPMTSKNVRYYKQAECEVVIIDINCHIQGDIVLECISLNDGSDHENIMFRAMFNTSFIRSNILILNRDEIDVLWDIDYQFPNEFKAEILFSEMDAASSVVPIDSYFFEEKEGLPIEAFAKVQEMFNSADWLAPKSDAALNVFHQIGASDYDQSIESTDLLHALTPKKYGDKERNVSFENDRMSSSLKTDVGSPTYLDDSKNSMFSSTSMPPHNLSTTESVHPSAPGKHETLLHETVNEKQISRTKPPLSASTSVAHSSYPSKNLATSMEQSPSTKPDQPLNETAEAGFPYSVFSPSLPSKDIDIKVESSQMPPCLTTSSSSSSSSQSIPSTTSIEAQALKNETTSATSTPQTPHVPYASPPVSPPTPPLKEKLAMAGGPTPPRSPMSRTPPSQEKPAIKGGFSPKTPSPKEVGPSLETQRPPLDASKEEKLGTITTPNLVTPLSPPIAPEEEKPQSVDGSSLKTPSLPVTSPKEEKPIVIDSQSLETQPPPSNAIKGEMLGINKPSLVTSPPPPAAPREEKPQSVIGPPLNTPSLSVTSPKEEKPVTIARQSPETPLPPPTAPKQEKSGIILAPSPPSPPLSSLPLAKEEKPITVGPVPPPPPPPGGQCTNNNVASLVPPPPAPSSSFPRPPPPPASSSSSPHPPPPPPAPSSSSPRPPPPPPAPSSSSSHPPPPPPPMISSSNQNQNGVVPPPPPPSLARGVNVSGAPAPPPPLGRGRGLSLTKNQQAKKLKPLHWLKLTRAVQGSLWAETQKLGEVVKTPEIDISELENLFSAANPNSDKGATKSKSASIANKPEKVQLIDHRRAYNCEIMLSKVKIPLHELMDYVLALDESALDVDQVDNLIKFCPTKEEMEVLKGYKGERDKLGKCEQFFMELMKVPRTESKLRVFSFKLQFGSQVNDLRKSLNSVNSAVEQVRSSSKFKRVMQTILTLGNALNQGTARGSAVGFRLDSLLKLTDTRARNNRMTLMHYLCKVLAEKLPELLDFSKDLDSLEPASKVQLKYLAEEMQAISKGLEKVVQELSMAENDGPDSEKFCKALKEFLCSAEGEARALASLYSLVGKNVDALILYFGEDPARCPYEHVVSTLKNFVNTFNRANEENCKQQEAEKKKKADNEENCKQQEAEKKKKADKEASNETPKPSDSNVDSGKTTKDNK